MIEPVHVDGICMPYSSTQDPVLMHPVVQVFCTSFGGAVAAVIAFSPAVMAPAYQAVHVYEREAVLRLLAWSAFLVSTHTSAW